MLNHGFTPTTSNSQLLLPPPPSPQAKKDVFDIRDFINTSPFPASSQARPPIAKAEGRRLFGDDDLMMGPTSGHGPESSSRTQSLMGASASVVGKHDVGMLGSVLGPAMEANV